MGLGCHRGEGSLQEQPAQFDSGCNEWGVNTPLSGMVYLQPVVENISHFPCGFIAKCML